MADLERISEALETNQHNSDTGTNLDFMGQEVVEDGIDLEENSNANPHVPEHGPYVETFPGSGDTYGKGGTFMDEFQSDKYAGHRHTNIYYPFQTRSEWELASWLLRSGLSMQAINDFLNLELVSPQII
jgi:hypothetical protein